MDNIPPVIKRKGKFAIACFCIVLALAASCSLALLASHFGILFEGFDTYFTVFCGAAVSIIIPVITTAVLQRKAQQFTWRMLGIEVILTALFAVGFLSWFQTRGHLKNCLGKPVPSGLHVHRGRSVMFATYVHFSAPPEVIAAIIQSHQLAIPAVGTWEQSEEERMKVAWDWWQPATMSNPKFLLRHHTSEAVQGWTEGFWINDKTNEVYAYTAG